MASRPPAPRTEYINNVCSYYNHPHHNTRYCRGLQKDPRDGRVKAGTVLPTNFAFKGNSKRDHPYRNTKNRNCGRNGGNNSDTKDKRNNDGDRSGRNDNRDKPRGYDQRKKRGCAPDGNDSDSSDNRRKVYRQAYHETGLIAVVTTINPPLSLTAQANVEMYTRGPLTLDWFSDIPASGGSITVGGKNQIPIEGVGRIELDVIDYKGNSKTLTLHGVLYAPALKFSLLSIPSGVKHDFRFNFDRKQCAMQTDQRFNVKAPLACDTDLYQFQDKPAVHALAHIATSGKQRSFLLLHKRLGHPNVIYLGAKPYVDSMTLRICDPLPVPSLTGGRYFVICIDDYSRFMFTYPKKNWSQLYERYEDFRKKSLNIFRNDISMLEWRPCSIEENNVQVLQADNAKEYEKLGRAVFRKYGTHAQFTNAYTQQQNGVAERCMRTVMERVRALLLDGKLTKQLWTECVCHVTTLINMTHLSKTDGRTPYEI
ncbi:Gag-pol Polyprotein [Phytophthora palmivora]|uniref:Gag-pol Polyprotein n=1 Tax=Phytophthora palmivora TaxID=4796 RepID=A0A2P4XVH5_9STRA|nr:Gag-pol Polyprotein [Phytophthora palmivora]